MKKYSAGEKLILILATFFGLGFLPKAPGTFGTLGGVLIYSLCSLLAPNWLLYVVTLLFIGLSVLIAHKAGKIFNETDDGRIVIDEVAGYLVAALLVPQFSPLMALLLFAAFRLFDITKPWPASFFDKKVKNGFGVTMDDVAAGIYAGALVALGAYFIK